MAQINATGQTGPAADRPHAQTGPQPRVFVGLKIAPEIANQLAELALTLDQSSVRSVAPVDIHLTLVPPWNEASIADAVAKLDGIARNSAAFWLGFRHVGYGPQPHRPRLLWVACDVGDDGAALRAALLEAFGRVDDRPFRPHVTLARIRPHRSAISRSHPIDQPLSLRQRIESVELFQSPPSGERGYRVVASLRLGGAPRSALIP